jgi:hypothetical protein
VGAIGEDSNQTTITNGTGASSSFSASDAGAVYVYRRITPIDNVQADVAETGAVTVSWTSHDPSQKFNNYKVVYSSTPLEVPCSNGTVAYTGSQKSAVINFGDTSGSLVYVRVCAGSAENFSDGIDLSVYVDTVRPTVTSIVRGNLSPVLAGEMVAFQVNFSENVTNVSTGNFALVDPSNGGGRGTINGINCSGNQCSVSVSAESPGYLRLDLVSASGIVDLSGRAMTATKTGDEVYFVKGWYQEAYVKAANAGSSDYFGHSVSLSGDSLAVGAYQEASNQTTITNSTAASSDNSAGSAGAVYVYRRSGSTWSQESFVKAANAGSGDHFGYSVSFSGDTLAVGAWNESSSQTIITNGTTASADNSWSGSGAVYISRRTGVNWAPEAYIKAANANPSDWFGESVSLSGDTLAVGATSEDSSQTTVTNGTAASGDDFASEAGAVYVYRRSGSTWAQEAYVKASNANSEDRFGHSVSLSGDTLAVGAPFEDSNQTTITNGTGGSSLNNLLTSGAVYVYRRTGSIWVQEAFVKAANAESNNRFGYSVSFWGDSLAVGANLEDSSQTTITNGTGASSSFSASDAGAVYVYRRSGSTWAQEAYVKASNAGSSDYFGYSVSLSGDTLAVGAIGEDSNQTTITNGTGASGDNSSSLAGAVYIFRRNGITWAQEAYVKASNAGSDDRFGSSISLSGDTLAVGAPFEDSNQTTITNGTGASIDNSAGSAGAVYVYRSASRLFDPHVRVSGRTTSSVTLSWHANLGTTTTVKIAPASSGTASPNACTDASAVTLATGATSYTYSGLAANSKYGFRVCSFDGTTASNGTLIWENTLP